MISDDELLQRSKEIINTSFTYNSTIDIYLLSIMLQENLKIDQQKALNIIDRLLN